MSSRSSLPKQADVRWLADGLVVTIGPSRWTVSREELPTLIHLLEAGRSLDSEVAGDPAQDRPLSTFVDAIPAEPVAAPTKKRRSRKRVGDALIIWMEQNPGWHHEEHLLDIVIEHQMTDASPRRALKIALGKQRNSVFTEGGNGYWKLATDTQAGAPPRVPRSPSLRQRLLRAGGGEKKAGAVDSRDGSVGVTQGDARPRGQAEEARENGKPERWDEVSRDEVARARRNLLGLGSSS